MRVEVSCAGDASVWCVNLYRMMCLDGIREVIYGMIYSSIHTYIHTCKHTYIWYQ